MMPDGIFVYDTKGVGFVEYDDIKIDADTVRFIENIPPSDARVIDKTWKHPNKTGGPDKRFNDNCEIPICLYGKLELISSSGMHLYLMTSKEDSPSRFSAEFSSVCVHLNSKAKNLKRDQGMKCQKCESGVPVGGQLCPSGVAPILKKEEVGSSSAVILEWLKSILEKQYIVTSDQQFPVNVHQWH